MKQLIRSLLLLVNWLMIKVPLGQILRKTGIDIHANGNRLNVFPSETSKCRTRLTGYCTGNGIDIGPGGDPILPSAVRIDLPIPYSSVGDMPVQLAGDARDLYWFQDEVLDYVYSSHVLEDFKNTREVLVEWLRVLKPGGNLVLFWPDEQAYREHCRLTGQPYNSQHQVPDFSLVYVKGILENISNFKVLHENVLVENYSFELVVQKQ
jgi:SAM-dependent methyltransferase